MVDDHGKYSNDHPEPFYNGPGHPRSSIQRKVKPTLENQGNVEALKLVAEAVAMDFDAADSAEARSTLARTLSALINSIRLADKEKPEPKDDQEDVLDQLRKKKAEGIK